MRIDIPDDLAHQALRLLARPDHDYLTSYVKALLRCEIAEKVRLEKVLEEKNGRLREAIH